MAFNKCECYDGQTVITAKMMNDIQDAICGLEGSVTELDGSLQELREDVDALPEGGSSGGLDHMPTPEEIGAHPNTWMPTAEEVGARPDTWLPTPEEIGAHPNTWMPTAEEVGARPSNWTPTVEEIGAHPNTWMPTAEEVGAATLADVNAAVKKAAPRNLLDNSDFSNPVNQRGETSYTAKANKYTIDRWHTYGTVTIQDGYVDLTDVSSSGNQNMYQYFEPGTIKPGVTYTMACELQDGTILLASRIAPDGDYVSVAVAKDGKIRLRFGTNISGKDQVALCILGDKGATISAKWVALYEGEYTLETLPAYQPKGYGAELLECQRYFQIRSTDDIPAVDMRPTMRIASPTISEVTDGYSYSADL